MTFTPYPNQVYTTFSFFGFIMCMIPLPWHLKAWNIGTCFFMFWAGIGCFISFVNSIVWHGNSLNPAPIWCDICAKFIIGSFTGISASCLCINRRLYLLQLNPAGNFAITKPDRIRSIAIDLGISLGLPTIMMILHYVYQGHRFDIFENIGCSYHTHNSWVTILLMNVPPVVIGLVSATYGIRAIISITRRRNQFNELLARRLNITSSLYFRLMCFAVVEALTVTPITVYFIVYRMKYRKLEPWVSWKHSHLDVHRVEQYPATEWHKLPSASGYEFTRWIHVLAAFLFFSIFGFAEEAKSRYRLTIKLFLKLLGIRVGHQTERFSFQAVSQSDPTERVALAINRPRRTDSLSTISISPDYRRSTGERRSPSGTPLRTRGYIYDHLGSQTGPDSADNFLTLATNAHVPAVERESSRNLGSFLDLDDNDSVQHVAYTHSTQMDISTIEEGQPSKANRRSSNQFKSQPLHSFLSLT